MSSLHRFLFTGLPVRGMLVRLTDGWQEVLRRRGTGDAFPAPVRRLLGEMTAAGVLMQANIKFDGALILQVYGDGPVKLAVVETQSDLAFRATAKVVGPVGPADRLEAMLNVHGGGRCVITLDPQSKLPGRQPYQGIVPLFGIEDGERREPLQHVSQVLEHYMLQSEQLDTRLVLAANDDAACGLLIQRLPVEGAGNLAGQGGRRDEPGDDDPFQRIALLAATMGADELLSLDADAVLHRLFWEEPLQRLEPLVGDRAPHFACTCSRDRVGRMLRGLGVAEVDGIVAEQGRVEIGCEFCGKKYHFDPVDVGELFTALSDQAPGSSAIN